MLSTYRAVLARPGAWQFSLAGALARFPMAMVGIGLVLMVRAVYGSYGLAGTVSGTYVVVQSACSPLLAALVDRHGQAVVMRPAVLGSGVGLAALVVCGLTAAPVPLLYGAAVLTGATMGSFGAMVRARWSLLLRDEPHALHTAYSLESALDEAVFVIGPVATTFAATTLNPAAGLVLPGLATIGGGLWFLGQRGTAPAPAGRDHPHAGGSALRVGGMPALMIVFLAMGAIFGGTDVSTVALATQEGRAVWAGPVLAAFALGSLTAGLLYGARPRTGPLHRSFVVGCVALALGASTFALVGSLPALAGAMVLVGLTIAPTIICGNALVTTLVPANRLTEGLTWVGTALGVGVSIGSALAGAAIDANGARGGFLVVIGAGVAVLVTAVTATAGSQLRDVPRP